jgi:hypothetical protein
MSTRTKSRLLFAAVLVATFAVTSSALRAQSTPTVVGKTMAQWSAIWWQWALAIPADSNPLLDTDGAFCAQNQSGAVWFLGGVLFGGTTERSCTVPRGRHLLLPIANAFWIQTPLDDPHTEQEYRELAQSFLPTTELFATLDGKPLVFDPRLPIVRTQSAVFTAVFPAGNVFGLDPSLLTGRDIVSDGYWVMLPPLTPGAHELKFGAGGSQDVTYHLLIQ